jgi:hypothetical protein
MAEADSSLILLSQSGLFRSPCPISVCRMTRPRVPTLPPGDRVFAATVLVVSPRKDWLNGGLSY